MWVTKLLDKMQVKEHYYGSYQKIIIMDITHWSLLWKLPKEHDYGEVTHRSLLWKLPKDHLILWKLPKYHYYESYQKVIITEVSQISLLAKLPKNHYYESYVRSLLQKLAKDPYWQSYPKSIIMIYSVFVFDSLSAFIEPTMSWFQLHPSSELCLMSPCLIL